MLPKEGVSVDRSTMMSPTLRELPIISLLLFRRLMDMERRIRNWLQVGSQMLGAKDIKSRRNKTLTIFRVDCKSMRVKHPSAAH